MNDAACVVTTAPSYFGTAQTFKYDPTGSLQSRSYEFGAAGYGPFTQTVDAEKTFYTYTTPRASLEKTDRFIGGTGNLYDGLPEMMVARERQRYNDGKPDFDSGSDTVLTFQYDDKKRLSVVTYHLELMTYDVYITYSRQMSAIRLELEYDNNDNVIRLKQVYVYREGVYIVNNPANSYFTFLEDVHTVISVAYDDKPSPFTAISKYWKFVQGDWGYVTNSNWQSIIASLSKNNPVTIAFETYQGTASQAKIDVTYNYNAQGFPTDGFTYNCQ
jgi:hypothetical protein